MQRKKKMTMDQSERGTNKREIKSRKMFEPTFEPTYKRKEATFLIEDDEDDLANLDPTVRTFEQLLSCLEQGLGKESGKLKDPEEDLLKSQQNTS